MTDDAGPSEAKGARDNGEGFRIARTLAQWLKSYLASLSGLSRRCESMQRNRQAWNGSRYTRQVDG